MDILTAIIMGIVEGLTEFAPVSSTGHLILAGHLLDFTGESAKTFEIIIQLGSILAVIFVFWRRILSILGLKKYQDSESVGTLSIFHIAVGIIPFGVGGVLFYDLIKNVLFSPATVVITLIIGGLLMLAAEKLKPKASAETLDQVTYRQALTVGFFQCFALVPGFSRSGATLSGGLLAGMSHKTASEFTFIMAVPIMFAASAKDLFESWNQLGAQDIPVFAAGFVTAFIVALIAIKFFLRLINKVKLIPFAIYRFGLAIVFWIFII
ncbi:undecaprenyl-diphosphate phosphatase [Niallia taxi]|uniref:Undecaprenyl-diphosphatase n=1 Tax=Niallia taxi TaxID=2499688 RepID=A0A3S2TUL8_9BACI|nr:undecaprenyl-diphosphate phosphatase [Niallia taxi]MCM3216268.1 undecaprenyl-diphosphate phosphatase [Niallia taxi]MDK8640341.1 undecaprenyl-diphosphate phosphatase [Niallia taxi]MED4039247.1 undecaprenyl-diphosphate phosphatase [Niallia taxi]RVT63723.1 undecaprenyl-diphosphate phosphatase [Niallia taxi]